ncbi:radical SAM protein [Methanoplanus endosymbiosus]|uniref:Radical SAM protein n=1 Tax=Methanoplanus endosymbiosus TaxID=33865 RepID=A0A9E7PK69_9EURY|nr:radical SAM protein [Methanoplanus endosymbiosus]UUX91553.1 radical SAM protein [Methanoplanus endosymbiosus]
MKWSELKAGLLEAGTAKITGGIKGIISVSTAGPSSGEGGSVFFSSGNMRVRLSIADDSPVEIVITDRDNAVLKFEGEEVEGRVEPAALHCPRQAFITVSEGCIFRCRYCSVPTQEKKFKSPERIEEMIEEVLPDIDCISLTSGVIGSPEEDEERVIEVVKRVMKFGLPLGVSIYPLKDTPEKLHGLGVLEVKFNLETATDKLFREICPGMEREQIMDALIESVRLFGKNRVFTNIILGAGESDSEMKACISELTALGIIPVIRPLTPKAEMSDFKRPSRRRILDIAEYLGVEIRKNGLDTTVAETMCTACTGCDLVPGRDF